jgi:hypothetical protein
MRFVKYILLLTATIGIACAQNSSIQKLPLNEQNIYAVGIAGTPATTIMLPYTPTAFQGTNFTTTADKLAPVFIEYTPGTKWFTIRALLKDAVADLNLIMNGKAYGFHFTQTDRPVRILTLVDAAQQIATPAGALPAAQAGIRRQLDELRLLEIIDESKRYFIMKEQMPEQVASIQVDAPGNIITYTGFTVLVDIVWKFPKDDAFVFRVVFDNETPFPITYDKTEIGVRIGQQVFWQRASDLSGIIPAATFGKNKETGDISIIKRGQSFGYIVIAGNPDGTPANIALYTDDGKPANTFNMLIRRIEDKPKAGNPTAKK